jgi:hypothetical protein
MPREEHFIKMWPWKFAPEGLKALSQSGGDEDWVVFVPQAILDTWYEPTWLMYIDTMHDAQEFIVDGGKVYIGAHA